MSCYFNSRRGGGTEGKGNFRSKAVLLWMWGERIFPPAPEASVAFPHFLTFFGKAYGYPMASVWYTALALLSRTPLTEASRSKELVAMRSDRIYITNRRRGLVQVSEWNYWELLRGTFEFPWGCRCRKLGGAAGLHANNLDATDEYQRTSISLRDVELWAISAHGAWLKGPVGLPNLHSCSNG